MTPLEWMTDAHLCGATFGGPTWEAGRALVAAIFGLPMTPEQMAIYCECTRRTVAPVIAVARAMIAAGRGAGKTLLGAFIVVFIAASRDFHAILGPGELACAMLLCPDRRQTRVAFRYVRGLLRAVPMLADLIVSETKESITLSTGCVIEIHTSNYKSTRGYSLAAVVLDECAFLDTAESANPDVELVRALTPGLARVPGSLLLAISSPYSKRGVLWDNFRRHHGVDGAPVLTWQAPTRRMNPTISESTIAEALADDPAAARSEWLAEFRDDIASYIDADTLRAVVIPKRDELPPCRDLRYWMFADPASGSGGDAFAWAIGHRQGDKGIVDKLGEIVPPFSPDAAVRELAAVARAYKVTTVVGDRWGGAWVAEKMRAFHLSYREAELTRSQLYLEALPILTAQRCELPDHPKMLRQFAMLDRKTGRQGKDSVDHPSRGGGASGCHDDLSNVTAGLLVQLAAGRRGGSIIYLRG